MSTIVADPSAAYKYSMILVINSESRLAPSCRRRGRLQIGLGPNQQMGMESVDLEEMMVQCTSSIRLWRPNSVSERKQSHEPDKIHRR
jgi:hypothetical protein